MARRDREDYLKELAKMVGNDFELKRREIGSEQKPIFTQITLGIEFSLIPGGEFSFGLSEEEENAARKISDPPPIDMATLRPVLRRQVSSFLLSTRPIAIASVTSVLGQECLSEYDQQNGEPTYPAYLNREDAARVASAFGCRFPTELEWEYGCRANTATLFPWGNNLPSRRELGEWLDLERPDRLKANGFGLCGLFSGDWCLDQWTTSHLDDASAVRDVYVVKGGGSVFWPWQGSGEWKWCMPANRMPSTGLVNGRCAFRLVRVLQF
jgi:formylglycine-generating enzyme required for sulfatase activity